MDADSLLALVRFHAWANDRILATAAELSIRLQVLRKHPFAQRSFELKRNGCTATTDDDAQETVGLRGRCERASGRATLDR